MLEYKENRPTWDIVNILLLCMVTRSLDVFDEALTLFDMLCLSVSLPYVPEYTIPSTYIKSVIKTKKSKRKNKTTKNKKGGGKNRKYFTY